MQALSIYEPIQGELAEVEESFRGVTDNSFPFLSELLNYVLDVGGKRVRPAITLLASRLHPNQGKEPIIMAAAVELLHAATLIHDDTVDNSDTRRGRATVSSLWGRDVAVLLGDYVFAASATFVCDTNNIRVIRRFSETLMELSNGELYELSAAYNWHQTREDYWKRIYNKTASLFSTAAKTGAILSDSPEEWVQALESYGCNLGMAFQVVDDILDFQGTEEEVGKPVGNDLLQGTLTLPSFLLMERYHNDNPIPALFQDPKSDENLKRVVEMIQDSSIIEDSYAVAREFVEKARSALDGISDSVYRRSLLDMLTYVLERRH